MRLNSFQYSINFIFKWGHNNWCVCRNTWTYPHWINPFNLAFFLYEKLHFKTAKESYRMNVSNFNLFKAPGCLCPWPPEWMNLISLASHTCVDLKMKFELLIHMKNFYRNFLFFVSQINKNGFSPPSLTEIKSQLVVRRQWMKTIIITEQLQLSCFKRHVASITRALARRQISCHACLRFLRKKSQTIVNALRNLIFDWLPTMTFHLFLFFLIHRRLT